MDEKEQIAEIVLQNPSLIRALGQELANRILQGIHDNTSLFWGAVEILQEKGVNTEIVLVKVEDAIEKTISKLEE